ncbi:MAG: hypothetical protein NVS3B16_11240 [Vulcanimicrobiaceae bacterium]
MKLPTRRSFVRAGASIVAAGAAIVPARNAFAEDSVGPGHSQQIDGTSDPFPIPWLDRNGSHNQVPAPNQEPAHIFHFRGDIARCNDFEGMGTDGRGNRTRFGGPTTDVGLMRGEYVATDGTVRTGTFLHL